MALFRRKIRITLLIGGSLTAFIILVWQFLHGGNAGVMKEFVPVNEQMLQLIDQTSAGKEAASTAGSNANPAMDPKSHPPAKSDTPVPPVSAHPTHSANAHPEPSASKQPTHSTAPADSKGKLELNSATLEQLDALPGIGESKAKAILVYRKEKGPFRKLEDLLEVKGIGDKMLEKLIPLLYIANP